MAIKVKIIKRHIFLLRHKFVKTLPQDPVMQNATCRTKLNLEGLRMVFRRSAFSGRRRSRRPLAGHGYGSSSVSSSSEHASGPAKHPAGRTKFRETWHPVYHGVRRRGNAGRNVSHHNVKLTTSSEDERNVTDAVVPVAVHLATDGVVVVVDINLEAENGDMQHDEVVGDDNVAAASVLPYPDNDHRTLEVLDLDPELAPLVGREPHHTRELHHHPLLHHLHEIQGDDEHGEVLLVHHLHAEAERLGTPPRGRSEELVLLNASAS
uniref:Uncharacterized protein n=1 Tax=Hordeum vulgare subsp. vulgare TaxID=112509 RepID=A0A023INH2_HORVV|nr:hypothetical protein [Hordeum vulgare subsp. vulgare]